MITKPDSNTIAVFLEIEFQKTHLFPLQANPLMGGDEVFLIDDADDKLFLFHQLCEWMDGWMIQVYFGGRNQHADSCFEIFMAQPPSLYSLFGLSLLLEDVQFGWAFILYKWISWLAIHTI